jgi:serine phosphatase RsbU (regulator of sigma subunit)
MLGVLPPDAFSSDPWQEPFSADDRVVMYTDGLSETLGRGGDLFGSERVAQAVASGESPERVAASAAQFHVGAARDDLLVVEVRGA